MPTKSYIARLFGVDREVVSSWIHRFQAYLRPDTDRSKDSPRHFSAEDLMVFALVADHWDSDPDYENICAELNSGAQNEDKYRRVAYLHTPLFQTDFESIGESQRGIVLIGGMQQEAPSANLRIAEAYKTAGDELVTLAISSDTAYELAYPILFAYRHALEVYLKLLVPQKDDTHDFTRLIDAFRAKYNTKFAAWAENRLLEFHRMDRWADTFRYAEPKQPLPNDEQFVNLNQLRVVVDHLSSGLRNKVLGSTTPPGYLS